MKTIEHLLTPVKINAMELTNRVVMPPMGTKLGDDGGAVSEANLAYWRRRSQSGAGLYIAEILAVSRVGQVSLGSLGIWDDSFVPGLRGIVEIVHARGGKIAAQLHHCGRESLMHTRHKDAVAPSAVPSFIFGRLGTPREMTRDEIHQTVLDFGAAAVRARDAGFDAVELHGAHGYLLMQFLAAHSNTRRDEYGGDFRSRSRFMRECLQEVRRRVGPSFPILLRISGEECIEGGYGIEDVVTIVPDLVAAGADALHVSFGTHADASHSNDTPNASAPVEYAPGFKVHLARRVKEVARVPVITVGRFTDPYVMDEVIARGDADLVAVGRQHLADPDFLENARRGHPEDTIECIACNQGCIERMSLEARSVRCAINPETGQEFHRPVGPAPVRRSVWVVGAGPAGLTAAFEASRLGHEVTLFDREQVLGGQIRYAQKATGKTIYGKWIETLAGRCRKNGVDIRTGTEVTVDMVEKAKPDVTILATGAVESTPAIDGVDTPMVCDAWSLLDGGVRPGQHVVVIGGGLVGMETADYLCQHGVPDVTLVEVRPRAPVSPASSHGTMLHRRLAKAKAKLCFGTTVDRIEVGAVTVSAAGGTRVLAPVDQVVLATGVTSRRGLAAALEARGIPHVVVGDAQEPRRIIEATEEAARVAWKI